MGCNCGKQAKIRASVESKMEGTSTRSPAPNDIISAIRQKRLEAIENREKRRLGIDGIYNKIHGGNK